MNPLGAALSSIGLQGIGTIVAVVVSLVSLYLTLRTRTEERQLGAAVTTNVIRKLLRAVYHALDDYTSELTELDARLKALAKQATENKLPCCTEERWKKLLSGFSDTVEMVNGLKSEIQSTESLISSDRVSPGLARLERAKGAAEIMAMDMERLKARQKIDTIRSEIEEHEKCVKECIGKQKSANDQAGGTTIS